MQTGRQGWGKAQDSFLPPLHRSHLGEGRSYLTHNQSWPCHRPVTCYVYFRWTLGGTSVSSLKKKGWDSGRAVQGQSYEILGQDITADGIFPRVVKNSHFTPKNSLSLPFSPFIACKLETFPLLLLIFIIHYHFNG